MGNFLRISLDNNQSTVIPQHNEMTVLEAVENTCSKRQLQPAEYYLKLGMEDSSGATGKLNPNGSPVKGFKQCCFKYYFAKLKSNLLQIHVSFILEQR